MTIQIKTFKSITLPFLEAEVNRWLNDDEPGHITSRHFMVTTTTMPEYIAIYEWESLDE